MALIQLEREHGLWLASRKDQCTEMDAETQKNAEVRLRMARKQLYSGILRVLSGEHQFFAASILVQISDRYFEERENVGSHQKPSRSLFSYQHALQLQQVH